MFINQMRLIPHNLQDIIQRHFDIDSCSLTDPTMNLPITQ